MIPDLGTALLSRLGVMIAGSMLTGFGSGLYLAAGLGPGPRDGVMTGLHKRLAGGFEL